MNTKLPEEAIMVSEMLGTVCNYVTGGRVFQLDGYAIATDGVLLVGAPLPSEMMEDLPSPEEVGLSPKKVRATLKGLKRSAHLMVLPPVVGLTVWDGGSFWRMGPKVVIEGRPFDGAFLSVIAQMGDVRLRRTGQLNNWNLPLEFVFPVQGCEGLAGFGLLMPVTGLGRLGRWWHSLLTWALCRWVTGKKLRPLKEAVADGVGGDLEREI